MREGRGLFHPGASHTLQSLGEAGTEFQSRAEDAFCGEFDEDVLEGPQCVEMASLHQSNLLYNLWCRGLEVPHNRRIIPKGRPEELGSGYWGSEGCMH